MTNILTISLPSDLLEFVYKKIGGKDQRRGRMSKYFQHLVRQEMMHDPDILKEELIQKQDEVSQIQANLVRYEQEVQQHPEIADCDMSIKPLEKSKPQGFVVSAPHKPLQFDRPMTDDEVEREAKNLMRSYGDEWMEKTNWGKVPFNDDDIIKIQNRCKEMHLIKKKR